MREYEVEQGTDEWFRLRLGVPTASRFKDILPESGKPSASMKRLTHELIAERVAGVIWPTYQNEAMKRGNELEPEARDTYAFLTGNRVDTPGFCLRDEGLPMCGCSPDGLIGEDGGLEIKCPSPHVHVSYLLAQKVPAEYFPQVQGCLFVTGRRYWDFFSYHPDLPPFVIRAYPDSNWVAKFEKLVEKLNADIEAGVKTIGYIGGGRVAA